MTDPKPFAFHGTTHRVVTTGRDQWTAQPRTHRERAIRGGELMPMEEEPRTFWRRWGIPCAILVAIAMWTCAGFALEALIDALEEL